MESDKAPQRVSWPVFNSYIVKKVGFALKTLFPSTDYEHTPEKRYRHHAESSHIFCMETHLLLKTGV